MMVKVFAQHRRPSDGAPPRACRETSGFAGVGLALGLLALAPRPALCETGAGVKIGTLGLGAEMTVEWVDNVNLRGGFNMMQYTFDSGEVEWDTRGQRIDLELDWQSLAALLDWHPGGGSFRLSGGLLLNRNEMHILLPQPDVVLGFNDQDFLVADLRGKVTFDSLCPYVGLGFGNAADRDYYFHLCVDLGIMFHGEPAFRLQALASDPDDQDRLNLAVEEERVLLAEEYDKYNWLPVLSVTAAYTF